MGQIVSRRAATVATREIIDCGVTPTNKPQRYVDINGREIVLPDKGRYYNLATGRQIKWAQPDNGILLATALPVAGTTEQLQAFARANMVEYEALFKESVAYNIKRTTAPTGIITTTDIRQIPLDVLQTVSEFNLNGVKALARVLKVSDGDTVQLVVSVPLSQLAAGYPGRDGIRRALLTTNGDTHIVLNQRVRFAHLDAAEVKLKGRANPLGQKATTVLTHILQKHDYFVWAEFLHNDKYGRPLVVIYPPASRSKSINQELLEYRDPDGDVLFKPYEGSGRIQF